MSNLLRAITFSCGLSVAGLAACAPLGASDADASETNEEEVAATEQAIGSAPAMKLDDTAPIKAAKHAFVLHHGFSAAGTGLFSFHRVKEALEADGNVVVQSTVPPFDSIDVRTHALETFVEEARTACGARVGCDASKVNIIAHSMGGLDARHLVSAFGWGDRVASLTTIGTPHRGTPVADVALWAAPELADPMIDLIASFVGEQISGSDIGGDADMRAALEGLSEKNAPGFSAQHPNDARVYYQSWAGVSSVLGLKDGDDANACEGKWQTYRGRRGQTLAAFWASAPIVAGFEGRPNDGLIGVASAKWGNFRGCIPADHGDLIGQPGHDGASSWNGFDHRVFYRNVARDLARRGL